MKKKLAFILGGATLGWLVLIFLMTLPVLADAGPHVQGGAGLGTSCAGCHRAHTASAPALLKEAQPALCYSCHGLTGQGARADVEGGVWYPNTNLRDGVSTPATVSPLRGGGFVYALIDSADTAAPGAGTIGVLAHTNRESAASAHQVNPNLSYTMWGSGGISGTPNAGDTYAGGTGLGMTCGTCHDPHGNNQYRILRKTPDINGVSGTVTIGDAGTKTYTTTDYWSVADTGGASQFITNISGWCSTCHSRYDASGNSARTDSGDAIFTYRHRTDGSTNDSETCIQCHVAHGSNAVNTADKPAAHVGLPGQPVDNPTENLTDSRLLRLNDRGVCVMCHDK